MTAREAVGWIMLALLIAALAWAAWRWREDRRRERLRRWGDALPYHRRMARRRTRD